MSWADMGRWLRDALASLGDLLWALLALALDAAAGIGPLAAALCAVGYLAALVGLAALMQRRLNRRIEARPGERVRFLDNELWFFLPAWPVLPFVALWRGVRGLARRLARLGRRKPAAGEPTAAAGDERRPFLAASLGPTFLLGGAAVAVLFLAAVLLAPLLAARYGLAPGTPPWQYLLLGGRPELAPYLPLERRAPYLGGLLLVLGWGTVWWWAARLVRLGFWRRLGGDLLPRRDEPTVLAPWRDPAEVRRLVAPARAYRQWSGTLLAVAAPLAAMAWLGLAGTPYRVGIDEMAVALVVGFAWATHLLLRGAERAPEAAVKTGRESPAAGNGWPAVRDDLDRRLQMATPHPVRDPRPIARLEVVDRDAAADELLSPLLAELMPAGRRFGLTAMQEHELRRLARLGHVFTRPPGEPGELRLGGDRTAAGDDSAVRRRNRVVLAPEGSGKTTLAILAAANHALVHTRASLLVVRDRQQAQELYRRIVERVDPSTLRWNLRVRLLGDDMAGDLTRGIVPDVVVASLHHLAAGVLDQVDVYGPLLCNLGLIVVDDAESFAGAVETHAQLAFRRLGLACRKLLGVEQLGDRAAPLVLALAAESMHKSGAWVESLCGVEAEVERYAARPAGGPTGGRSNGRLHEVYRLGDFRSPTGERLDVVDLVESCERLGVAWCYRRAVDGERHRGRSALLLRDEPAHAVDDPLDAAVILVEGAWSEVQREIDRLALAGARFPHGPVALVTLADPDEEMAFTQWDDKLGLAAELATLPRPVLRPPSGRTTASHLAADLTQSWTEVADLLGTFGHGVAPALRELAREGLLLSERRTDIHPELHRYENKVFVRALASAVARDEEPEEGSDAPLPPKVSQVELACERSVPVIDRTDLGRLALVDADSAPLAYYPGRVFSDARGRWAVMHRASEEGGDAAGSESERRVPAGAVLVEPLLADDLSSPRRRLRVEVLEDGASRPAAPSPGTADPTGHAFYGPDPVVIGRLPVEVALAKVEVAATHHATYLLGPVFGEVRQRRLFDAETRASWGEGRLETVACCLYPNPEGVDEPRLRFADARLLAAAMRVVLPSMLRGAGDSMEVALHLAEEHPDPDHVLAPREGFFLFDLHHLGNGTARALYRDGVELLLRLARLLLERVLYHDRLRALHDQWPDEQAAVEAAPASTEERRQREEHVRHRVLDWLDHRLRPEGGAAALSGLLGQYGSDLERGEGDPIDTGRCWFTRDGAITDLVWSKHCWRLGRNEEAMADVGFDRATASEARRLPLDAPALEAGRRRHRDHLAGFTLAGGTPWGGPRGAWRLDGEAKQPRSSQPGAAGEAIAAFHEIAAALAWHVWPALGPLADKLREGEETTRDAAAALYGLAGYVASFVAGIPGLRREEAEEGLPPLRPPIEVLLLRRGTTASKSLLLAVLLARLGVRSGLFVSAAEGRVLAAAALPEPLAVEAVSVTVHRGEDGRFASPDETAATPEVHQRGARAAREVVEHLAAWSTHAKLPQPPALWADLPSAPEEGSPFDVYVPIETAVAAPPGAVAVARPESWVFLPLTALWHQPELPQDGDADEETAEESDVETEER